MTMARARSVSGLRAIDLTIRLSIDYNYIMTMARARSVSGLRAIDLTIRLSIDYNYYCDYGTCTFRDACSDGLSGLALTLVYRDVDINVETVITKFAEPFSTRIKMVNIMADDPKTWGTVVTNLKRTELNPWDEGNELK